MKIQQYKLQLVNKILEIEDYQLLETINKLIDLYDPKMETDVFFPQTISSKKSLDKDLDNIQNDIDEVFGN